MHLLSDCLAAAHCAVVSLVALALPASVILYKLRAADILWQPIAAVLAPPPSHWSVFSSLCFSLFFSLFLCGDCFIRLELKTHFSCHYHGLSPSTACISHGSNFINLVYYRALCLCHPSNPHPRLSSSSPVLQYLPETLLRLNPYPTPKLNLNPNSNSNGNWNWSWNCYRRQQSFRPTPTRPHFPLLLLHILSLSTRNTWAPSLFLLLPPARVRPTDLLAGYAATRHRLVCCAAKKLAGGNGHIYRKRKFNKTKIESFNNIYRHYGN